MTPRSRLLAAGGAVAVLAASLTAALPAQAIGGPGGPVCSPESDTGRTSDSWIAVGNIFAGAGVTGKLEYQTDASTEFSVEGGVSVDGGAFKSSASQSRNVQLTDTYTATDMRAGLLKRLRFRQYQRVCRNPTGTQVTYRYVRATGFLPGWSTTAVRSAPRGFPNCKTYTTNTNRGSYPTKIEWSKSVGYTRTAYAELSVWAYTAKVTTTKGNTVTLSYTSDKPGWVCWAGDPNEPVNMNFAATLK